MQFLHRYLPKNCRLRRPNHRGFVDFASIKHLRDRGLDHAVQREKHLKPMLNIKNLIKSEPAKSLPLSVITQKKDSLEVPTRPIEFIRRYPSIFEEFFPGGIGVHPHVKLTQQVLDLDAEEQLVYQSESYRQNIADRLLKLLMVSRINKIPLRILDDIKWDLGLPDDYLKSIVPEFPDCFRVIGNKNLSSGLDSDLELELVCWSNELAISFIEKKATRGKLDYKKGAPFAFPMHFSKGFEMDKQLKKWFNEWQKLPYISPYENATHLGPSTDESDKWTVGVLHEIISLFVSKKVEKDTLLSLGEWLGIRSRLKRALLHHPGIFYLPIKLGTYTVVLKDAYKRGMLTERNPLINIRSQYMHLMNIVTEDRKVIDVPGGSKQEKKPVPDSKDEREKDDSQGVLEVNDVDSDFENDDDYKYDDDEEEVEEEEGENKSRAHRNAQTRGSRTNKKKNLKARGFSRNAGTGRQRLIHKHHGMTESKGQPEDSNRDRLTSFKSKRRLLTERRTATSMKS